MKNYLTLTISLFLVAAIAAGGLAYYNGLTKPVIEKLQTKTAKEARKYVMLKTPLPENLEKLKINFAEVKVDDDFSYYKALSEDQKLLGYTFLSKQTGFSGTVETMVGVDTSFNIINIKVVKHSETPGLGAETQVVKYGDKLPFFEGWFQSKNALQVIVEKDDPSSVNKVQSITGATITTRAVCNGIKRYSQKVKKHIEEASNE